MSECGRRGGGACSCACKKLVINRVGVVGGLESDCLCFFLGCI